jgi:hypothetical protein
MKKYKKKPSKLLQIRLSENEFGEIVEFIKKFDVTHREWILAVKNELADSKVLRENKFWKSNTEFAYANSHRYDKKVTEDSKCEECGEPYSVDYKGYAQLERHHYLGYEGDNAFKVQILCKKCHQKK